MILNRIALGIASVANRILLGFRYSRGLFAAHVAKFGTRGWWKQEVVNCSKKFCHAELYEP